ncbi:uncharacterized protein LOC62_07G009516 [Vanrija pseudolonga]|uniref:Zn(2)-C6 fungal-type domain-containing protein n=1 Tax=Vanrija pseudolonga TaxID=143232 RepID=A0AAF0YI13_9TREE|nr:hypothetical protein LOC62_07G009516 [Vanrija pseudolonga]
MPRSLSELRAADEASSKRRRYERKSTGCRPCRLHHVKCVEGALGPSGRKLTCRRCWETQRECFYPVGGSVQRGKLASEPWERAEEGDCWTEEAGDVIEIRRDRSVSISASTSAIAVRSTAAAASPGPASPRLPTISNLISLLTPAPASPLSTFTLASLTTSPLERTAVTFFETRGCTDIVAAATPAQNWIFTQLLPRVFASLLTPTGATDASGLLRKWLHNNLLELSCIQRSHVEGDAHKAAIWRAEAGKYHNVADGAMFRAKVLFPSQWKTDEYLMGFYIRCVSELLTDGEFNIDAKTSADLPSPDSDFHAIVRQLVTIYAIQKFSCTPVERMPGALPAVELLPDSPGLRAVEDYFGFTPRAAELLQRVSSMVAQRSVILSMGTHGEVAGMLLAAEAEGVMTQLVDRWEWDEEGWDAGRPGRVQRGNEVMRCALIAMLHCEVLNRDLDDARIVEARKRGLELVADAEADTLPGMVWPLSILAIYTRDKEERTRVHDLVRLAITVSYGAGYPNPDDVFNLCWDILDSRGKYENGIAPWREAMKMFGKSLLL